MGEKIRYSLIILFFASVTAAGQSNLNYQYIDSMTYKFYLQKEWDKLIRTGKEAVDSGIDYKFLRQRLGVAYFAEADYLESRKHFKKAESFDSYDQFNNLSLYYTYLNTVQSDYSWFYASKLPDNIKKDNNIKQFKLVESIDLEYNFKYAATNLRGNPQYVRAGIASRPFLRLGIYQMAAVFDQDIAVIGNQGNSSINNRQSEYYALLKLNLSSSFILKSAYHYFNINYSSTPSRSDLGLIGLSACFSRFNLDGSVSVLNTGQGYVNQYSLGAGVTFTGRRQTYLVSSFALVDHSETDNLIFTQKAGIQLNRNIWAEGNVTFGNLTDFHDFDALYLYNSVDPTVFKSGITSFFRAGKKFTLWANYNYEMKEYYELGSNYYNQFSYLIGIKWNL
jgi:hypothetical protein